MKLKFYNDYYPGTWDKFPLAKYFYYIGINIILL